MLCLVPAIIGSPRFIQMQLFRDGSDMLFLTPIGQICYHFRQRVKKDSDMGPEPATVRGPA